MKTYHHKHNLHRYFRRWRAVHRLSLVSLIFVVLIIGVTLYIWRTPTVEQNSQSNERYDTHQPQQFHTFTSDHFIFGSSLAWEISRDTSSIPNTYIYYARKDGLVTHELTILRNTPWVETPLARVQLIEVADNQLKIGKLSPKCKFVSPAAVTTFEGVSFHCLSGTSEQLIAASDNRDFIIELNNSRGEREHLSFLYRDLRGKGDEIDDNLEEILRSFRLR